MKIKGKYRTNVDLLGNIARIKNKNELFLVSNYSYGILNRVQGS